MTKPKRKKSLVGNRFLLPRHLQHNLTDLCGPFGSCEKCKKILELGEELEPYGKQYKFKHDFKKTSDEFWKDIIYKDGKIDEKQVLLELADHYFLLHEIPMIYDHATGGLLSKQMYFAHAINPVISDYITRSIEEEIQSNIDEGLLIPTEEGLKYYDAKEI